MAEAVATRRKVLPTIVRSKGHLYTYGDYGPVPGVTRMAGLQDSLSGADGLMGWAVNLALDEVAARCKTGEDRLDHKEDWPALRSRAFNAKNRARDTGSSVHAAVDRFNRGQDLDLTDVTAAHVAQYGAFVHRHGVKVIASERYVINTTIGFGGTYDLLAEVDGELALVDAKTGKAKMSQRLQLTGLSMGELHGDDGSVPEDMPAVSAAYVLLLRPDSFELIRHDITDADREHFKYLVETYYRIRAWEEAA